MSVLGESAAEVRANGALGNIALVVISEDPNRNLKEFLSTFEKGQAELAALSPNSERITATNSGHQIQLDRPDIVVGAIRNIVDRFRAR